MEWLNTNKLLIGHVLDFGCGKGKDSNFYKLEKYDPYFFPNKPQEKFNTIACIYVLNVLEPDKEDEILEYIKSLLTEKGIAYLAVRRDIKKEGFTAHHTYQRNVILSLPVLVENSRFCIYQLDKYFSIVS